MSYFNQQITQRVKGMSLKEVLEFSQSEEYWRLRFYNNVGDREALLKLGVFTKQRNLDYWNWAKCSESDEVFIELDMIHKWMLPPTYNKIIHCAQCGDVPYKTDLFKQVSSCIWCENGLNINGEQHDKSN